MLRVIRWCGRYEWEDQTRAAEKTALEGFGSGQLGTRELLNDGVDFVLIHSIGDTD